MRTAAVVMAAGLGTRMKSEKPKVLHEVCGKPMLQWVLDSLQSLRLDRTVVVLGGPPEGAFRGLRGRNLAWAEQRQRKGTAHAVMQAEKVLPAFDGELLVLSGDVPLLRAETLKSLLETHRREKAVATVLTAVVDDPKGYGRILRQGGRVVRIVEELDADDHTKAIREINTGTYCFDHKALREALGKVRMNPVKREYYLTDVVGLLTAAGGRVVPLVCGDASEMMGVNTRRELEAAERVMRGRILRRLMESGVTVEDAATVRVGPEVEVGQDTVLRAFSVIEGRTRIGPGCVIGPGARIVDATLGRGVRVTDSWVVGVTLEDGAEVGPYENLHGRNLRGRDLRGRRDNA